MKYIIDLPQPIQEILLQLYYKQMKDIGIDGARYSVNFLNSKVTDIDSLYGYVLELTREAK